MQKHFVTTQVFGSTGFGSAGFLGITRLIPIPILKLSITKVQSNTYLGITDKLTNPKWFVTSENLCITQQKMNRIYSGYQDLTLLWSLGHIRVVKCSDQSSLYAAFWRSDSQVVCLYTRTCMYIHTCTWSAACFHMFYEIVAICTGVFGSDGSVGVGQFARKSIT